MNWEAIGAVGELLGSVGVLVTLVYLALQIRQNTASLESNKRFAQAQIYQARADAAMKLYGEYEPREVMAKLHNPDRPNIPDFERLNELSEGDRGRLVGFVGVLDTHADNIEMQRSLGLLEVEGQQLGEHYQAHVILYEFSTRLGVTLRPSTRKTLRRMGYDVPEPGETDK